MTCAAYRAWRTADRQKFACRGFTINIRMRITNNETAITQDADAFFDCVKNNTNVGGNEVIKRGYSSKSMRPDLSFSRFRVDRSLSALCRVYACS